MGIEADCEKELRILQGDGRGYTELHLRRILEELRNAPGRENLLRMGTVRVIKALLSKTVRDPVLRDE